MFQSGNEVAKSSIAFITGKQVQSTPTKNVA